MSSVLVLASDGVGVLVLDWSTHADGAVRMDVLEPMHRLGGGELGIADALPGTMLARVEAVADQLGLVRGVQRLSQSNGVGISFGDHRGDGLAVGHGLPVTDGSVLRFSIGVVSGLLPRARAPGQPFQGVQRQVVVQAGRAGGWQSWFRWGFG